MKMIHRIKHHIRQVRIDGEWYNIVWCENCGSIRAIHERHDSSCVADDKFKCCKAPNFMFARPYFDFDVKVKEWLDKNCIRTK